MKILLLFQEKVKLPKEKRVAVAVEKIGDMRKSFNELPTGKKVAVGVGCTVGVIAVLATEGAAVALIPLAPAAYGTTKGVKALKKKREERRAEDDPSCQYSLLSEGLHEAEKDDHALV